MNDGGPAFPHDHPAWAACPRCNTHCDRSGMSLRDYFAGQALAGMLAPSDYYHGATYGDMATYAYSQADPMLEARKGGDTCESR